MAITDKYVSSAGDGDETGSSVANAKAFADFITDAVAGERWNMVGNHSLAADTTMPAGSATAPIILRGYYDSLGGLTARGRTDGNGSLVTTNVPVITCGASYQFTTGKWNILQDLVFTGAKNGAVVTLGESAAALRVGATHTGTGAGAAAFLGGSYSILWDCDATMTGASGGTAAVYLSAGTAIGCRIKGNQTYGVRMSSGTVTVGCTVYSSLDCISCQVANSNILVLFNTLVGPTSDGLHLVTGPVRLLTMIGNLITDATGYGIYSVDAAASILAVSNRLRRNNSDGDQTSGAADWLAALSGLNNTTSATQANEFPGYGSADFRLGPLSPARQIGIPLYADIGALQRVEDYPAVTKVYDDTVDGTAGTLTLPAEADVESGVTYGVGGTGSTGTLEAGGGTGGVFVTKQQGIGV